MPSEAKDHIKDYLEWFSHQKESTARKNARKFRKFCHWLKDSENAKDIPKKLIEGYNKAEDKKTWKREVTNRVLRYAHHLEEQGYSLNTVRTNASAVLSFYSGTCETVEGVTEKLPAPQLATGEHRFTQAELRKMFYYADTEEKALLSLAVSLGYGSKDFLRLECELLKQQIDYAKANNLEFIGWVAKARTKTSIQPRSFLTPEAITSVDAYLQLLEKKFDGLPKYIWCNSKLDKHITNQALNYKLRKLTEKANIKTRGNVHFHLIRKFTYSRFRHVDPQIAKVLVAKKASASDLTYTDIDKECERVFRESYKEISLNGDVTGETKRKQAEQIDKLRDAILSQEKQIVNLETRLETVTKGMKQEIEKYFQSFLSDVTIIKDGWEYTLGPISEKHHVPTIIGKKKHKKSTKKKS